MLEEKNSVSDPRGLQSADCDPAHGSGSSRWYRGVGKMRWH